MAERTVTELGCSLVLRFDGSVRYGPANADPRTAAIGYVIEAAKPLVEGSRELSAFVSSTHVEFRALVAGARAVTTLMDHRRVSDVHVRGDAAAVINTVDPSRQTAANDGICQRRAERVQEAFRPVPTVTYRHVSRNENERTHELATRAYGASGGS
jgi:ribonuclease HI